MAHVWIRKGLEDMGGKRAAGITGTLDLSPVLGRERHGATVDRRGELLADEREEAVHSDGSGSGSDEYRSHTRVGKSLLRAGPNLLLRQLARLEVLLDQRVVRLGDRLHELLSIRRRLARDVVGPVRLGGDRPARIQVRVLVQQVRDALEVVLLTDR
jgi:hypothetical protein